MTTASREPCTFCEEPTRVRISVRDAERPGRAEVARRICKDCFKAIIDHLMETRPPK